MKKPARYEHLAPNGARNKLVGRRVYKHLVPSGTKSVEHFFRTSSSRAANLIQTASYGDCQSHRHCNSEVNVAPPKLGKVATIFTTLCESFAIQTVCLSASLSVAVSSIL